MEIFRNNSEADVQDASSASRLWCSHVVQYCWKNVLRWLWTKTMWKNLLRSHKGHACRSRNIILSLLCKVISWPDSNFFWEVRIAIFTFCFCLHVSVSVFLSEGRTSFEHGLSLSWVWRLSHSVTDASTLTTFVFNTRDHHAGKMRALKRGITFAWWSYTRFPPFMNLHYHTSTHVSLVFGKKHYSKII